MDSLLSERARLLRKAVATVVEALGERGVAYRRNLDKWVDGLEEDARILVALPAAVWTADGATASRNSPIHRLRASGSGLGTLS